MGETEGNNRGGQTFKTKNRPSHLEFFSIEF